jgi:VanZ family protein
MNGKEGFPMRSLLILLWSGAIFIATCTASFNSFIDSGDVQFRWNSHPEIVNLLAPLPLDLNSAFLLQKCGHALAFLILTLLLQTKFHSKLFILFLAICYSSLTEFLQLYFTRDGRIFDIGFDLVGVLFALAAGSLLTVHQSRHTEL